MFNEFVEGLKAGKDSFLIADDEHGSIFVVSALPVEGSTAKYVYVTYGFGGSEPRLYGNATLDAIVSANGEIHLMGCTRFRDEPRIEDIPVGVLAFDPEGCGVRIKLRIQKLVSQNYAKSEFFDYTDEKLEKEARDLAFKEAVGAMCGDFQVEYHLTDQRYKEILCGFETEESCAEKDFEEYKECYFRTVRKFELAKKYLPEYENCIEAVMAKALEDSEAKTVTVTFAKNGNETTAKVDAKALLRELSYGKGNKLCNYASSFTTRKERDRVLDELFRGTDTEGWCRYIYAEDIRTIQYGKKILYSAE